MNTALGMKPRAERDGKFNAGAIEKFMHHLSEEITHFESKLTDSTDLPTSVGKKFKPSSKRRPSVSLVKMRYILFVIIF